MAEQDSKLKRPSRQRKASVPTEPLAIVGIGVCAASLASIESLFAGLDRKLGAAYLVAVRQQDGLGVGTLVEALTRLGLPVKLAADGERLEPDHVYVGGPDEIVTLDDGHVGARPATEPVGHRGTVDSMLISVAERAQDRSVAVILAGLGSDGTAGVTATKEFGGLSIAESLDGEADAAAMTAASPAGVVDLLLPIAQIPKQIALYVANLVTLRQATGGEPDPEQLPTQLGQIATVLRNVTGNDFHGYKRNTFLRRVQRRMQVVQAANIDAYVERLRNDREEALHLFQDLLIGVTHFFRDPQEFDALEQELPRLLEGKGPEDQVRVWVLGCATGEEAYSLAILLREHLGRLDSPPQAQIFATDLDSRALGLARAGRYAESIADHVRPDRLARWFVKEGDTYCVTKELREMCIFSPHNLVKDAPFSRIDLLSCRNLLIYLDGELQNRVIPIFHFSLRSGGVLFLGSSENVTRHPKLFAPVDRRNRLFRRLDTATRVLPDFPLSPRAGSRAHHLETAPPPVRMSPLSGTVSRRAEQIAERYAPAYVVIDAQHDVLHFSGRTGRYLEPNAGAASLNLLNLVHRDLRLDLRSALHKAAEIGERIETTRLPFTFDGRPSAVSMVIEPIGGADFTAMVVVFQDAGAPADPAAPEGERLVSDEHVQRLETDLRLTKERLQATIEELESTNEELKSSNEEYQSINEELQSANEELETSKEELQSVNEELQTVNSELAHRVGELGRANSDLKNLLESTQIATIFLDNDLRVRNFTPAATDIFHLIETDTGRPIDHFGSRVAYPELKGDAQRVLKTLAVAERSVQSVDGDRHYLARVLPYRSIDNFIAGVVLTFLDVTTTVRAEAAMRESEARLQIAIDAADLGTWDYDPAGDDYEPSPRMAELMGLPSGRVSAAQWREAIHPDDRAWLDAAMAEAIASGRRFEAEHRLARPIGGVRWLSSWGQIAGKGGEGARLFHGVSRDVTGRRLAEEHQRLLIAELQHRTRNLLAIVQSIGQQTLRSSETLEDFGREFGSRLAALSRVQGLLSRGEGLRVTLGELIERELEAHGASIDGERISAAGPEVALSSREVQVLALALHELTTNASKYGALANGGQLSIRWSVEQANGTPRVALRWAETGVKVSVDGQQAKRGFGRELIERALPYDLGAETSFQLTAEGVRCEFSLPLGQEADGDGAVEPSAAG